MRFIIASIAVIGACAGFVTLVFGALTLLCVMASDQVYAMQYGGSALIGFCITVACTLVAHILNLTTGNTVEFHRL